MTANLTRDQARARASAISVSSYDVHVDLSNAAQPGATTYRVQTRVEFTFDPAASSDSVSFVDYLGVSAHSLIINGQSRDVEYSEGHARIPLEALVEGTNVVELETTSRFSRSGEGLHRFEDPSDGEVYLYTQYEPADCRRVFPVFDQPDMKAQFRFALTGPQRWLLRSNSPEVSRTPVSRTEVSAAEVSGVDSVDGAAADSAADNTEPLVRVEFAPTALISSYITALLAGPYHLVEDTWTGGVPGEEPFQIDLALMCRASLAEHLDAGEIFEVTRRGLDFFHRTFRYPYPWGKTEQVHTSPGKYDQVFVPEYNLGAMENPGLVTFTEAYVFDTAATEAQHQTRANTILHEMAHMWFGDLVTMNWWDDLWLKESFADYMGAHSVHEATDFTTAWISFAISRKGWAYVQDQLPTTHPIVADIVDLEAADQNFDGITYAKGASVLKQLAAFAGRESFDAAAQTYFSRHAFGNATLEDFLSVLEEVTGKNMDSWARAWLQTSGIPVLSTQIDESGTVSLTQEGTDPATGDEVLRPHVVKVGLFTLDGTGELARAQSVPVDIAAGEPGRHTTVPGLQVPQEDVPRLILPNDDDLTYAKLSLDAQSVAAALTWPISDPLASATVWAALWSMTRDGELPAARFVEAVSTLGLRNDQVAVVSTLLKQADYACEHYLPEDQRQEVTGEFTDRLAQFIAQTQGGDLQRAAARVLASVSQRHPGQLELLAHLLDGRAEDLGIQGLSVDEELRWAFLTALTAHGRISAEQLDAELRGRTTARGKIAHRRALAARPEPGVKQAAFAEALAGQDADGAELSNDHLTATITGFCADPSGLTESFREEYFQALTTVWERMTQGQATRVVRGLFPAATGVETGTAPDEHPVAVAVAQWLDHHGDAPAALRRILIEEQDHLLRALRAQSAVA